MDNHSRALRAAYVLGVYIERSCGPVEQVDAAAAITDLLADLLHLADETGRAPYDLFQNALTHFEVEVLEEKSNELDER